MKLVEGQVAVITGGASGIGLSMAKSFLQRGMKVVIADIEHEALDKAMMELSPRGAEVIGVRTDVSDPHSVDALAEATLDAFGAVHLLCNNAGVDTGGQFATVTVEAWRWVIGVNLLGTIYGCRTFLPLLEEQNRAHIVNTGSVSSYSGSAIAMSPYIASKFGVAGVTENLATELKARQSPVGVSLLVPGPVRTRMLWSERNRPSDVPRAPQQPERRALVKSLADGLDRNGLESDEVANMVVSGIEEERFFILTHPEMAVNAMASRLEWMRNGRMPPAREAGT